MLIRKLDPQTVVPTAPPENHRSTQSDTSAEINNEWGHVDCQWACAVGQVSATPDTIKAIQQLDARIKAAGEFRTLTSRDFGRAREPIIPGGDWAEDLPLKTISLINHNAVLVDIDDLETQLQIDAQVVKDLHWIRV